MGNRAAILSAVFATALPNVSAACSVDAVSLRGDWGSARFSVNVADDEDERAKGLMFVDAMPRFSGMLFVYDTPRPVGFWMENTLIPLDMIFVGADGVVSHIHTGAIPGDRTVIMGGDAVQYVLEVNAGLVDLLGISVGSEMQHPAIDGESVAWPCGGS